MKFTDRYPLKVFQEHRDDKLWRVMRAYPLATVISQRQSYPAVSQLPLICDTERRVLSGHLDRNNPHCEALAEGGEVYCVFNGPNHYMSPEIYPDSQFPGWNYIAVHVEGTVRPVEDRDWLEETLIRTAEENEAPGSAYRLLPSQDNFDVLIDYILGIEIEITDMRGIFKLAQDKGPKHAELARRHLASMARRDTSDFLGEMLGSGQEMPD